MLGAQVFDGPGSKTSRRESFDENLSDELFSRIIV